MESKDHPVSGIQIRLFPSKSQNAILISTLKIQPLRPPCQYPEVKITYVQGGLRGWSYYTLIYD